MSEIEINKDVYEKLTPQKQQLVDIVMHFLKKGDGLWKKGWRGSGTPESAITGKKYHGMNSYFLTLASMIKGYSDNRWMTYKQMEDKGWHFKTDEEGKSLGKNAGVVIEFYELRDKETKQPFDKHVLDGMSADERDDYMRDNVYPIRKYYRVFNGDIIDGIPEKEKHEIDISGYNERAEKILQKWSDTEARIIYGGNDAYYRVSTDKICLPEREKFIDLQEFYATALHEVGHSTGHPKRLNRELKGLFGTSEYAKEELRAEIASMFIEQELGIAVEERHLQNNSAYIKEWLQDIAEDPNVLFNAIADADKISKYVIAKEQTKEIEPFAIKEDTDELGEPKFVLYMTSEYGQLRKPFAVSFNSRDELIAEIEKMQELPFYADKELKEVSLEELQNISLKAAGEKAKEEDKYNVVEEKSEVYIKPSEIAAKSMASVMAVDMTGRGIESLTKMSDREVVESASSTKNGEKFSALYNGISVHKNEEKDARSLLARIAVFTGEDKEQLLRIFQSSGQFREGKPSGYYDNLAQQEMQFVSRLRSENKLSSQIIDKGKGGHVGLNSK